jgi:formate dehydrogenase maturation protein FdhE
MLYCPFCDGQGVIYKAKIKDTQTEIYICDECDTIWRNKNINENNCERFKDLMNSIGYKGLWSELTDLERL